MSHIRPPTLVSMVLPVSSDAVVITNTPEIIFSSPLKDQIAAGLSPHTHHAKVCPDCFSGVVQIPWRPCFVVLGPLS